MDLESWKNTVIYTRVHSSCLFDALLAEWLRSTSLDSSVRLVILFFRTYLDPDWNLSNSYRPLSFTYPAGDTRWNEHASLPKAYLGHLMCGGPR